MNAIEIRGLKKSFRGLHAVDGLDMTVYKREVTAKSLKLEKLQ